VAHQPRVASETCGLLVNLLARLDCLLFFGDSFNEPLFGGSTSGPLFCDRRGRKCCLFCRSSDLHSATRSKKLSLISSGGSPRGWPASPQVIHSRGWLSVALDSRAATRSPPDNVDHSLVVRYAPGPNGSIDFVAVPLASVSFGRTLCCRSGGASEVSGVSVGSLRVQIYLGASQTGVRQLQPNHAVTARLATNAHTYAIPVM